uniref:Cytochrome b n=2 Tax=unclassified Coloceras TaxID=2629741 RepID=D2CFB4_9NEOP|nr:cytochrome b [Coloceras sp. SLC-2005]AEM23836.1 cytochrome b [Coloceras sp. SLC-2011]
MFLMYSNLFKSLETLSFSIKSALYNVPIPSSISYFWNFGSLLGLCLFIQLVSGIFLSFHYSPSVEEAFLSVVMIEDDVPFGWMFRSVHANGASFFFFCIYLHIGRGLYFGSYKFKLVWISGVLILFLLMGTAFIGYVLPWGQMSLWGATVITSLLSAIPYLGSFLVEWVWGGFSVSGPTLHRFFSLHYLLPIVLFFFAMVHIFFLHEKGSSNPMGVSLNSDKVYFVPYFLSVDLVGVFFFFFFFFLFIFKFHDLLMDPDNFVPANPMSTPPHIQPEWYFLFAYSILRSIPSKFGGVMALVFSILFLVFLPFMSLNRSVVFRMSSVGKFFVVVLFVIFFLLTWIGSMPVEFPYESVGKVLSMIYFFVLIVVGLLG